MSLYVARVIMKYEESSLEYEFVRSLATVTVYLLYICIQVYHLSSTVLYTSKIGTYIYLNCIRELEMPIDAMHACIFWLKHGTWRNAWNDDDVDCPAYWAISSQLVEGSHL
jgi:hypothetical protein